jgi:hypothetical protein
MNEVVEIWDNFENLFLIHLKLVFLDFVVRLKKISKSELENCLSIKFICNLDFSQIFDYVPDFFKTQGLVVIAEVLKTNCTLQRINLEENRICNEGAIVIADALKINSTVPVQFLQH